ncbi:MAG: hypothetical protein U1E52_14880 [Geminicoccaceae bacterium]
MTRRAALLLARLRRHEVDQRRLALLAIEAEQVRLQQALESEHERLRVEHLRAFELPGGPGPFAPFAEAGRRRRAALAGRGRELETRRDEARADLRDAVRDWKSLDLVLAAMQTAAEADAARRRQVELEESALLRRAGSQNSGASVTFSPSSAGPNLIWQDRRELSRTS